MTLLQAEHFIGLLQAGLHVPRSSCQTLEGSTLLGKSYTVKHSHSRMQLLAVLASCSWATAFYLEDATSPKQL